jgi:hypothetical protein
MAIPDDARAAAEAVLDRFCEAHSSTEGGDRQRFTYEVASSSVLLIQQRPSFMSADNWTSKPVAKFRYSQARSTWSLYWPDANERWRQIPNVPAEKNIDALLKVVLSDPLGVFWS